MVIDPLIIRLVVVILLANLIIVIGFIPARKRKIEDASLLYQDRLIEFYPDRFVLNGYYFGPFGRKTVRLGDIVSLDTVDLNLRTGKYRIQGTGDFRTWFPQDLRRSGRKKAFIASLRGKRMKIGFTVEDFERVQQIFCERGWLKEKN
ncbi:hypothetical protein LLH00_18655 [bacterium]|nr:hypothetical protein [bacterium]